MRKLTELPGVPILKKPSASSRRASSLVPEISASAAASVSAAGRPRR